MSVPEQVLINGRFLAGGTSATYAVARHLSRAFVDLVGPEAVRVLVPEGPLLEADGLPVQAVGRRTGNAWEQIDLPRAAKGGMLLNLAARSPLFLRNAMTMVHDAQVYSSPASYSLAFRASLKANLRLAGARQVGLLTVSAYSKSELVGLGLAPAARVHVIPNGVDHVLAVAEDRDILARLGLGARGYALALANTQAHKNIGILLRAFADPALAGVKLVLVGRADAADFAGLGHPVPANVIFAGYVSDGAMRSLQAQALAVLMPSLTEGFGMPPVEGMLLGTPAIIAPRGALPEVCGPGALQADPFEAGAWVAAIGQLQADPALWQGLATAGQAYAAQFTWAGAAKRLRDVLDAVGARP